MKIIRTTQLISAECYYTLNGGLFVLDIEMKNQNINDSDTDILITNNVNNDGSLMVSVGSVISQSVSLYAEDLQDIIALQGHRLFDHIDDHNLKIVFVSNADINNLTEEERVDYYLRLNANAMRYAANMSLQRVSGENDKSN